MRPKVDHDQADVAAALGGDRDALARLLMAHSGRLSRRVASRLDLNPFRDFSTDDVLQEVFIDVFSKIGTFRPDDGTPLSAWLDKIADHRLVSMLRERSRKKRGGDFRRAETVSDSLQSSVAQLVAKLSDHREETASAVVARDEMVRAVQVGLAALPHDQREAMQLHYIDQRSLESTAKTMRKTDGAIRGLLHRAKRSLRGLLDSSTSWFSRK